jgi:hypothetical protein
MAIRFRLRSHRLLAALAAVGFLAMASGAQAFTFDNTTNTNSDGSARYADPDQRFSNGGGSGLSTYKFGGATLQLGRQPSLTDQRYYPDRAFNPNGKPGDER